MNQTEKTSAVELSLYQSNRAFSALQGVAFLLRQTEGNGPNSWDGKPFEQLTNLLELIADHGEMASNGGLELAQQLSASNRKIA